MYTLESTMVAVHEMHSDGYISSSERDELINMLECGDILPYELYAEGVGKEGKKIYLAKTRRLRKELSESMHYYKDNKDELTISERTDILDRCEEIILTCMDECEEIPNDDFSDMSMSISNMCDYVKFCIKRTLFHTFDPTYTFTPRSNKTRCIQEMQKYYNQIKKNRNKLIKDSDRIYREELREEERKRKELKRRLKEEQREERRAAREREESNGGSSHSSSGSYGSGSSGSSGSSSRNDYSDAFDWNSYMATTRESAEEVSDFIRGAYLNDMIDIDKYLSLMEKVDIYF